MRAVNSEQNMINPDAVIAQAMQMKMNVYTGKEQFESTLKAYNESTENLCGAINLMKSRIIELENEVVMVKQKGAGRKEAEPAVK